MALGPLSVESLGKKDGENLAKPAPHIQPLMALLRAPKVKTNKEKEKEASETV